MESNPAAAAGTSCGVLPLDVLLDVLLRLRAKELCRLRVVSRRWRALLSDPLFLKEHSARHPGPLIVASFCRDRGHKSLIHVMDLSGHVVKRVVIPKGYCLLPSCLDLVCVANIKGSCTVINPANGAAVHLPLTSAEYNWNDHQKSPRDGVFKFAFGLVASTGVYKVLRVFEYSSWEHPEEKYRSWEVLTVNGTGRSRWREAPSPEFTGDISNMDRSVVVGGTVYFFCSEMYPDDIELASFDLETEEWTTIPGPHLVDDDDDDDESLDEYDHMWSKTTLAELKGYLVLPHYRCDYSSPSLDLWLLTDIKNCLWVKEYSIKTSLVFPHYEKTHAKPLLLLDDGRIVIFLGRKGQLLLYDPASEVFSEVKTRRLDRGCLYKGSLLSLQSDAKI